MRTSMLFRATPAAVVLAAVLLAGCGGDDDGAASERSTATSGARSQQAFTAADKTQAVKLVRDFHIAQARGQADEVCAALSTRVRDALQRSSTTSRFCAPIMRDLLLVEGGQGAGLTLGSAAPKPPADSSGPDAAVKMLQDVNGEAHEQDGRLAVFLGNVATQAVPVVKQAGTLKVDGLVCEGRLSCPPYITRNASDPSPGTRLNDCLVTQLDSRLTDRNAMFVTEASEGESGLADEQASYPAGRLSFKIGTAPDGTGGGTLDVTVLPSVTAAELEQDAAGRFGPKVTQIASLTAVFRGDRGDGQLPDDLDRAVRSCARTSRIAQ